MASERNINLICHFWTSQRLYYETSAYSTCYPASNTPFANNSRTVATTYVFRFSGVPHSYRPTRPTFAYRHCPTPSCYSFGFPTRLLSTSQTHYSHITNSVKLTVTQVVDKHLDCYQNRSPITAVTSS